MIARLLQESKSKNKGLKSDVDSEGLSLSDTEELVDGGW